MCGQKAAKIRPLRQKIRRLHHSTASYHACAQNGDFAFCFRCAPPNIQVDVPNFRAMLGRTLDVEQRLLPTVTGLPQGSPATLGLDA